MRKKSFILILFAFVILVSSCKTTRVLEDNQYWLIKNEVEVKDSKSPEFSNLSSYLRPVPNNKFMGVFNLKTAIYASAQPKVKKKTGEMKDSRFNQWLRNSVGEPPVLLDSIAIETSERNLLMALSKMGYFNAEVFSEVIFPSKKEKCAYVKYSVSVNEPYYVRRVNLDVTVPEFKRILVLNMKDSKVRIRTRYDATLIEAEIDRMVSLLRNEGYYNVNSSCFYCEVDTLNSSMRLDKDGHKTLSMKFVFQVKDSAQLSELLYRYYFEDVAVFPNYNIANPDEVEYDTTTFYSFRAKNDSTTYKFLVPKVKDRYRKNGKLKRDFKYRTLTDVIYSKYGVRYTESLSNRSKKGLMDLDNFTSVEVVFTENKVRRDSANRIGYLDATYRLVRKKVHSISGQVDVRSDKSGLSFTYANKNIFKGAEKLSVNIFGNYFYYSKQHPYPEYGIDLTLDFPCLFIFKKYQDPDALKYTTSLNFGMNYSGLYKRVMYNASYSYLWRVNQYVNHKMTPVEFTTLNTDENRVRLFFDSYPASYVRRFDKFFLLSCKYTFNYVVPIRREQQKHNMRFSVMFESSGLLLASLDQLFAPEKRWTIGGTEGNEAAEAYKYSTFEAIEFKLLYNYTINNDNSVAVRFNTGAKIPIGNHSIIPYEQGYHLGGSNSMRGFPFRGAGPGNFFTGEKLEYTGDIKLEMNLEYRGTIYKAFKYGIFVDAGNIWLAQKYEGMEAAQFDIRRFYKEIALCTGVGIRLDFNFFIIRLDYAVPVYDPRLSEYGGCWINKQWTVGETRSEKKWYWAQGFKFAIGHAF